MKKIILFVCIITSHIDAMLASDFPVEIKTKILKDAPLSPWLETIEEVNGVMNSLARTNKSWNLFINDSENMLSSIKKLSKRFGMSNMAVTKQLSLKEAQYRYAIQESCSHSWRNDHDSSYASQRLNNRLIRGLDINFTYGADCRTLLIKAIDKSSNIIHKKVVGKWLIGHGADINITTDEGVNAIMAALYPLSAEPELISLLLDHPQFDLDHRDNKGNTTLHYCFVQNRSISPYVSEMMCSILKKLLEKGANLNAANNQGRTPFDLARLQGHRPFLEILDSQYNS